MDQSTLKFELVHVFRSDATDILIAREKARLMHHGYDIHLSTGCADGTDFEEDER
jgi:hypothetical protein